MRYLGWWRRRDGSLVMYWRRADGRLWYVRCPSCGPVAVAPPPRRVRPPEPEPVAAGPVRRGDDCPSDDLDNKL